MRMLNYGALSNSKYIRILLVWSHLVMRICILSLVPGSLRQSHALFRFGMAGFVASLGTGTSSQAATFVFGFDVCSFFLVLYSAILEPNLHLERVDIRYF